MTRTPLVPVNPAVLRWAREDAGLSHEQLGRLAGVDALRARYWEQGDTAPTLAQLRQVADRLGRPVAFFMTVYAPEQHTLTPPDFRAASRALSPVLMREVRRARERRSAYVEIADPTGTEWRRWRDDPPATPTGVRDRLGVDEAAVAVATDPLGALRLWIAAFEAQGILVFQMSRVDVSECRGFALYDDELPVIVLNGADAAQGRCFTLLHELGHLLDHSGAVCLLEEDREVEHRCNRLAAAVLMPEDAVQAVTDEVTDVAARIDLVVSAFRVSPVAAALRLRALDLIDRATVDRTIGEAAEAARQAAGRKQTGGPAAHVIKRRNLGDRYLGTVLDALHRDRITIVDATYLLETNVRTVDRMEQAITGGAA